MYCKECGKHIIGKTYNGMCQGCYNYFKKGGTINPIPEHGRIQYDANGTVICHICGRAYARLGSHIKESHNMTIKEYKEMYGLCARARTTADNYSNTMRTLAYHHHMDEQLIAVGQKTRFQKGDATARKDKPVRLQEIIDKRERKYKGDVL